MHRAACHLYAFMTNKERGTYFQPTLAGVAADEVRKCISKAGRNEGTLLLTLTRLRKYVGVAACRRMARVEGRDNDGGPLSSIEPCERILPDQPEPVQHPCDERGEHGGVRADLPLVSQVSQNYSTLLRRGYWGTG